MAKGFTVKAKSPVVAKEPEWDYDAARERTDIDIEDWISKCQDYGAGEFLITSIDKEGTGEGFDLELMRVATNVSRIPIIAFLRYL